MLVWTILRIISNTGKPLIINIHLLSKGLVLLRGFGNKLMEAHKENYRIFGFQQYGGNSEVG